MFDPGFRLDLEMVKAREVVMGYGVKAVGRHFPKPYCALSYSSSSTG